MPEAGLEPEADFAHFQSTDQRTLDNAGRWTLDCRYSCPEKKTSLLNTGRTFYGVRPPPERRLASPSIPSWPSRPVALPVRRPDSGPDGISSFPPHSAYSRLLRRACRLLHISLPFCLCRARSLGCCVLHSLYPRRTFPISDGISMVLFIPVAFLVLAGSA